MKTALFICILTLTGFVSVNAQPEIPIKRGTSIESKSNTTVQKEDISNADDDNSATQPGKQNVYVRPSAKKRFDRYVKSVVGPVSLGRDIASAGIGTWRNSPEEWGTQWEGFGRRVASKFGKGLIKQTTIYGLDEALKLDSHFYRSEKKTSAPVCVTPLSRPLRPEGWMAAEQSAYRSLSAHTLQISSHTKRGIRPVTAGKMA